MNEFSIINKYLSDLSKKSKGSFGLTDDVFFDYQKKIAISIDTYNEKTHFLNFEKPNFVIKKVLRASISDLISKGIKPKYYFISFSGSYRHLSKKNISMIRSALEQEQKKYNIVLSGGDTSRSTTLSITITSVGYANKFPILRKGAKINDDIYITNNLGDSFIGLNVLKNRIKFSKKVNNYFINKFYLPNLPVKFSRKIHLFANSSIDVSDGLFQDLKHILSNSNLSSEIFVSDIPASNHLNSYLRRTKKNKLDFISNGDDYQILFTANKNKRNLIKKVSKATSTKVTIIGIIKNRSISKSIKLINEKFGLPKKLGYIHNFS